MTKVFRKPNHETKTHILVTELLKWKPRIP